MIPAGPKPVSYEDFPVGRVVETARVTVTEAHLVSWANLTGDWDPLHMDEEWAREEGPFGQRVAHGPFVFALTIGLMEKAGVFGHSILAWLGAEELRATAPTFIGDTLRCRATVLEARLSKSDPTRGVVTFRYEALNQREETVLSCRYVLMMRVGGGS
jgi:acyl dehydratase